MSEWVSRIVDRAEVAPDTLVANPDNYRVHPERQQAQLVRIMDQVGWVEDVIVNRTTGHLIDGHARVGLAIARGEPLVPVAYVELDEADEKVALATLDPITGMAVKDDAALIGLLDDVDGDMEPLVSWLRDEGRPSPRPTQEQIDRVTSDLDDKFRRDEGEAGFELQCPECGTRFGIAGTGVTS